MASETGLLLLNLGTPESPSPRDVGRYLREFLMDPLVIDLPWITRFPLVQGIIVPFRSRSSAKLYERIWTKAGSPLLVLSQELHRAVAAKFPEVPVELAMRYGSPSLRSAFDRLKGKPLKKLVVFPLYPQYSLAATKSSEVATRQAARQAGFTGDLIFVPPFYDDKDFLAAFANRIAQTLGEAPWDQLVFSYHGLPERQVKRSAPSACEFSEACCARITEKNRDCYRAQCFETSRQLAALLNIPEAKYTTAFQSRLGRTPWIRPYSDELYTQAPKQGMKRLVVASPSFVADCLETLEEIALRGKESFEASGGESLRLVPSLNASANWVDAVCAISRRFI